MTISLDSLRLGARGSEVRFWIHTSILEEMNAHLCRPITMLEIKEAVFQMGGLKAPVGFRGFSTYPFGILS